MKTALFISPHLDDVAFSCGGTLIKLALNGWRTINLTCFTKSILNPQNFALACQLDKGLSANVDYMKLRRAEDSEFARRANVSETVWLNFAEAPHRGYESAKELFNGVHEGDKIWRDLAIELKQTVDQSRVDVIFAPQGIGNHVDHLQTIRAVLNCEFTQPIFWYKDAPYTIRNPTAKHSDLLLADLIEQKIDVSQTLEQKINACCAYVSQNGFQFGGNEKLAETLREYHAQNDGESFLSCAPFEI